jgi:hypothetical protein
MSSEVTAKPIKTIRKKIAKTVEPVDPAVSVRDAEPKVVKETKPEKVVKSESTSESTVEPRESDSVEEPTETFRSRLENLIKRNNDRIADAKLDIIEMKKLQKDHELKIKLAGKRKKKVFDPDAPKRKPTGFAAPRRVTPEFHAFLKQFDVGENDLVSGSSVSSYMHKYLKSQNLIDPDHTKEFLPNAELKKILAPTETRRVKDDPESPLVYKAIEIQKYIKHHFIKNE